MRSRLLALAAFSAISLVASASATADDHVIASLPEPAAIDAYGGRVVWSERSAEGYRLMEYSDGKVRQLPVAPAPSPFNVDLGPNRKGKTAAIYSRCSRAATPGSTQDGRLGCDLYVYDFATGREAAIRRANSEADERFSTIWRNRIAFTRTYRLKGKSLSGRSRVYWRRFSGRSRTRRLDTAPRYLPTPEDLDMRGSRVGLFWAGEFGGGEVRLARTSGRTRVLTTVPGSGAAAQDYGVFGISLTAGFVYWMVTQTASAPEVGELRRYDRSRRREERATVRISPHTAGFAQDGSVGYQVTPKSEAGCEFMSVCPSPYEIHRIDGVRFEPADRLQLR